MYFVGVLMFKDEKFGYLISDGGSYTVAVSDEKAKELGVEDADILEYLDLPVTEIIPCGGGKYGVESNCMYFLEEFESEEAAWVNDVKLYYGRYFDSRYILNLDNDTAIQRMLNERLVE